MTLRKINDFVIYRDENYNSFPNVICKPDGELLVAFRHAPDRQEAFGHVSHVDPSSKAVFVTSNDNGETWSEKLRTLYDDYFYGVQDPCLNVLRDGTILATFFMWKVSEADDFPERRSTERLILGRYLGRTVGTYSSRSRDGGKTWDKPIPVGINKVVVRGNGVELPDGSFIVVLYGASLDHLVVARTTDQGVTWENYASIAKTAGFDFNETNLYRTETGKLVAFIRSLERSDATRAELKSPMFLAESNDDGRTWSAAVKQNLYTASPFHAIRLQSGRVLLTYGYRVKPFGLRARVLNSECSNVNEAEEIVLRDDGLGFDIGYSHAAQLADGRILITYYFYNEDRGKRYIAGTWCEEV